MRLPEGMLGRIFPHMVGGMQTRESAALARGMRGALERNVARASERAGVRLTGGMQRGPLVDLMGSLRETGGYRGAAGGWRGMSKRKRAAIVGGGVFLGGAYLNGRNRATNRSSGANGLSPRSSGGAGLYG